MKPAAALAALLLLISPAQAQEPAPVLVVELDYTAPADCPNANSFQDQVRRRTARVEFVEAQQASEQSWTVVIQQTGSAASGVLRVSGSALGSLERKVTAGSCEQVVSALALGAALSVDPEASLVARTEAPPPPPPPAATPPVAPADPPQPRSRTRLALGIHLSVRSALAPELTWAPRPFAGLSFESARGHSWGLRLSATQAHGSATSHAGQADFTWSMGRLEVFPVRFSTGWLRFEPALFGEAGLLRARGVAVSPVAEVRRPVVFVGGLGRLSLLAFDLLLLELEAGPVVALVRDRFYLQENTTVFQVPALGGFASAGVGLEFL